MAVTLPFLGRKTFADTITTPYVLAIHCSGGYDPTMVFDPKIGFDAIATEAEATSASAAGLAYVSHSSRPSVDRFFAAEAAHCAIVNGLSHGALNHPDCWRYSLTSLPEGHTRPVDWLTYYAGVTAPALTFPHLVIDAPLIPGDLYQTAAYLSSSAITSHLTPLTDVGTLATETDTAIAALAAASLESAVAARAPGSADLEKLVALRELSSRDSILTTSLREVDAALTAGPNDTSFTRRGKMALEFMQRGLSKAASLRFGEHLEWDTHTNHFNRQAALFEGLFGEFERLLAHARTIGLGDNLLIVLCSDFGRAPRLNQLQGKGRWQYSSMLLWGYGIKGGSVHGATDSYLRGVPMNPLFGTADGADDVLLEPKHVFTALMLKYGLPYERFSDYAPLSPLIA